MTDRIRPDAELLHAFVACDDEAALTEIVNRHGPMVSRVCQRILGNTTDAEDAAQAAFLVLVKKADSLQRKSALASWLYGVARNVSLHALRGRVQCEQREERYAMSSRHAEQGITAGEDALRESILASLDEALALLGERQRQAVVLRYLEGRSQKEASQVAGCSPTAISTRASNGIAKLRRHFAKRGLMLGAAGLIAAIESEAHAAIVPAIIVTTNGIVAGASMSTHSIAVQALAKGGIHMLFWSKVKIATVVVAGAVILSGSGLAIVYKHYRESVDLHQATAGSAADQDRNAPEVATDVGMNASGADPVMVLIPAGVNSGTDPDFGVYSLTNASGFYMDRYEVTKALWDAVKNWNGGNGYDYGDGSGDGKAANHPVHTVNWYDCVKWCNARSQKEGRTPVARKRPQAFPSSSTPVCS